MSKNLLFNILNKPLRWLVVLVVLASTFTTILSSAKLFGPTTGNGSSYASQSCVLPYELGDWAKTCGLQKFNPKDGDLRSVLIDVTVGLKSNFYSENTDVKPKNIQMDALADVDLVDLVTGANLIKITASTIKNYNLPAFDGTIDYSGNSGRTDLNVLGADKTGSVVYNKADNPTSKTIVDGFLLSPTNQNGAPDKQVNVITNASINGSANIATKIETATQVKLITFTYIYQQADISVTKSHSPAVFQPGKTSNLTFNVKNEDNEPTNQEITLTDTLPSYLTYNGIATGNGWTCTSAIVCKTNNVIAPGQSSVFSVNVLVDSDASKLPNSFVNNVSVKYGDFAEYNYDNNKAQDNIPFNHPPIAQNCDLGAKQMGESFAIKDVKSPCIQGIDPDTASLNDKIQSIKIKTLPNPITGKLTLNGVDLKIGDEIITSVGEIVFVPVDTYVGPFSFQYDVFDTFGLINITSGIVNGSLYENDLSINKEATGPKPFNINSDQTYKITVKNEKNTPIITSKTTVSDSIPDELEFKSATGTDWLCGYVVASKLVTCEYTKNWVANQVSVININVKVKDVVSNLVTNEAEVKMNAKELNLTNNKSSDKAPINHPPIAYDCDLGAVQQGSVFLVNSKNNNCLRGTDPDLNDVITKYEITSLPTQPIKLFLNGVELKVGDTINPGSENNIEIKPVIGYYGPYSFKYTVYDKFNLKDEAPAIVSGTIYPNNVTVNKTMTVPDYVWTQGSTGTYSITIKNINNTPITGKSTVEDVLPAELDYLGFSNASGDWLCNTSVVQVASVNRTKLICTKQTSWSPLQSATILVTMKAKTQLLPRNISNTTTSINEFIESNVDDNSSTTTNRTNNPPEAVDCDLGAFQAGKIFNLESVKNPCLTATDPDGDAIVKYIITSVVDPLKGGLYLNGVKVLLNAELTPSEISQLEFRPNNGYTGPFDFKYTAEDTRGLRDLTPATVKGSYYPIDVSIKKSTTQTLIQPYNEFEYTITAKNEQNNPFTTTKTTVTDTILTTGLKIVSMTPTNNTLGYNCLVAGDAKSASCESGKSWSPLEVNTFTVKVKAEAVVSLVNTNEAKININLPETNFDNNTSTVTTEGNNPPVAYDCDLGLHPLNKKVTMTSDCLKGTDPDIGDNVYKFVIKTLPNPTNGKISIAGVDLVIGDEIPEGIENTIVFTPTKDYVGPFAFTYTVVDTFELTDESPALVKGVIHNNDISIDKKLADPNFVYGPNKEAEYILTVTNTEPTPLPAKTTVVDTLPASLTYVSHEAQSGWNCNFASPKLTCDYNNVINGNQQFIFKVKAKSGDIVPSTIVNKVEVKGDYEELNLKNNSDEDLKPGNNPPVAYDCDLGKSALEVTVSMPGNCLRGTDPDANDSIAKFIITQLPLPSTGKLTINGADVTLGQVITPGLENTIKFVPAPKYEGAYEFFYTVEDTKGARDLTPARVNGTIIDNKIKITKTSNATTIIPNTEVDYVIKVKNYGEIDLKPNTTITDTLKSYYSYVSYSAPADWNCTFNSPEFKCVYAKVIPVGQEYTINLKVKSGNIVPNKLENTAKVFGDYSEKNLDDNTSTDEKPGNNPPVAYDCDLGKSSLNENVNMTSTCLRGTDPDLNDSITKFIIKTLPNPSHGKIKLNGVDITTDQIIKPEDENKIVFVPNKNFVGDYTFTYTVEDTKGLVDASPATVKGNIYENDIRIDKTLPTSYFFEKDKTAEYTITVKNVKDTPLKASTTVTDTLSASFEYVSHTAPAGWNCTIVLQEFNCVYPKVTNGQESFTIKLAVKAKDTLVTKNTAKVKGDYQEINLENNESTIEGPTNNPPETYNCKLPTVLVGTPQNLNSTIPDCLKATDPDAGDKVVKIEFLELPNPSKANFILCEGLCIISESSSSSSSSSISSSSSSSSSSSVSSVASSSSSSVSSSSAASSSADPAGNSKEECKAKYGIIGYILNCLLKWGPLAMLDGVTVNAAPIVTAQGKYDLSKGTIITPGTTITPEQMKSVFLLPVGSNTEQAKLTYTAYDTFGAKDLTPAQVIGDFIPYDLGIVKTSPMSSFDPGKQADYKITITNNSTTTIPGNIAVVDKLDPALKYVSYKSDAWNCGFDIPTNTLQCLRGTPFLAGEASVIELTTILDINYAKDTISNTAKIPCLENEKNCDNNTTTHENPVGKFDISIIKTHEGDFMAGETGKFNLNVKNSSAKLHDYPVELMDTLPAGMTIASFKAPLGWNCIVTTDNKSINCKKPTGLASLANENIEIMVNIAQDAPERVENTGEVKTNVPETNYKNNKSTDKVFIKRKPTPVTPRTGGQILGIFAILALLAIAFLEFNKYSEGTRLDKSD